MKWDLFCKYVPWSCWKRHNFKAKPSKAWMQFYFFLRSHLIVFSHFRSTCSGRKQFCRLSPTRARGRVTHLNFRSQVEKKMSRMTVSSCSFPGEFIAERGSRSCNAVSGRQEREERKGKGIRGGGLRKLRHASTFPIWERERERLIFAGLKKKKLAKIYRGKS